MAGAALTVVQLLPALDGGGVERGTLEVAAELVRRGHHSLVVSAGGRMVPELTASGSEHIGWPIGRKSLRTLRFVPRLRRLLLARQVDVLHARSRLPAWIGYLAWRGLAAEHRPKFVTTVHGQYSANRYSAVMMRGERVIAVSETVRDYIFANYPDVDRARVQVIYRGVDEAAFPHGYRPGQEWLRAWYERYPQLENARVITLPGRLSRLKGHSDFVDLLARLRRIDPTVHGLIAGGEEPRRLAYVRELRSRIEAAGLSSAITFTGHRSDMREVYAVSDLVLSLSSKPESFGRSVLEALSLGVPVVGYDHGGVGEILRAMFPAGLVPPADRDALVRTTLELIRSPVVVPKANLFPLSRMLSETLALYASMARRCD